MTVYDLDSDPFDATTLEPGDEVVSDLVTDDLVYVGSSTVAPGDALPTQMTTATRIPDTGVSHSAILIDGESGGMVLADRYVVPVSWVADAENWFVRQAGTAVDVTDAEVIHPGDRVWDDPAAGAERWANGVLQPLARRGAEHANAFAMTAVTTLTMRDPYDAAEVHAEIRLEDE